MTTLRPLRVKALLLLVVAAVLAASLTAAAKVLPKFLDHSRAMCADFTDATGLYPGNNVKLLDLDIGTVTSITNLPAHVRVDFTVPDDLDLPEDEGAITTSDSIVTDRHLELTKPYADGPKFRGSHCIGLQSTKTPVDINEAYSAIGDLADTIVGRQDGQDAAGSDAINQTLRAMAHALDGMGMPIKQNLQDLVTVLGDPNQAEADTRLLLTSSVDFTSDMIQHWSALTQALQGLPRLLHFLENFSSGARELFQRLAQFLPIAVKVVERFGPRIYNLADKIVPWISGVVGWLAPQAIWLINQLTPIMHWLTNNYNPGWGAFDITYSPQQGGMSPPMATALCDALRARNVPGIETTCAPGTSDHSGLGLTDLLMGAALR